MSFRVRYTEGARNDLRRLYAYMLARDPAAARRAIETIKKGMDLLKDFLSLAGKPLRTHLCCENW